MTFFFTVVVFFIMDKQAIKNIVKKSVSLAIEICGSQGKLAVKAGITQGAVGKYFRGESLPRGETAIALSKATGGKLLPFHFAPQIFASSAPLLTEENFVDRRTVEQRANDRRSADRREQKLNTSFRVMDSGDNESPGISKQLEQAKNQ